MLTGSLGLIVKATRNCNLRCAYCHDWRAEAGQRMSFDVMATMMSAALRDSSYHAVDFIWHGGEPTVLPLSFYEKVLYVQSRLRQPGQIVTNSLQTNATRITPEWARFFRLNDFKISISLDGPFDLHDRYRVFVSGRPSSTAVTRGMSFLREWEVPFGVLMVIDEGALDFGAKRIFDFFLQQGIRSYGLLAAAPVNQPNAAASTPTQHYVDSHRMNTFLADIYDCWLAHGDPRIRIRELAGLASRLKNEDSGYCTLAGGCLGRYYAVEPNGDVAHCDLFLGDPDYVLGNVRDGSFAKFAQSARMRALQAQNERALARVRTCPEFAVCNGWCPHERYLAERHHPNPPDGCCGLRPLIEHMRASATRATTTTLVSN